MRLNKPIKTNRLLIREFTEVDWPAVLDFMGEAANVYTEDPLVTSKEDAIAWIRTAVESQEHNPRMRYIFAVVLRETDKVIGYHDFVIRHPYESKLAYSGYGYAPEYWSKGYGTETLLSMLDFGFHDLDLFRISLVCDPDNIGSWRIMEKCGLRKEGHETLAYWDERRKKRCDRYWYAMLNHEWQQQQSHSRAHNQQSLHIAHRKNSEN